MSKYKRLFEKGKLRNSIFLVLRFDIHFFNLAGNAMPYMLKAVKEILG